MELWQNQIKEGIAKQVLMNRKLMFHADAHTETVLEDHDHPFVAKEEVLAEYSDEQRTSTA